MASFVRFLSSVQKRNLIALSMLTNRATLLINIMSMHKSRVELCSNSSLGISIQSSTLSFSFSFKCGRARSVYFLRNNHIFFRNWTILEKISPNRQLEQFWIGCSHHMVATSCNIGSLHLSLGVAFFILLYQL